MAISVEDAESMLAGLDKAIEKAPPEQTVPASGRMTPEDAEANLQAVDKDETIGLTAIEKQLNQIDTAEPDSKIVRGLKSIGSGGIGTFHSMASYLEAVGRGGGPLLGVELPFFTEGVDPIADSTRAASLRVGDLVKQGTEPMLARLRVENPAWYERLLQAGGSLATFWIPGVGVMSSASMLGASAKTAVFLGTSASTIIESAVEAGSVYDELVEGGMDPKEAKSRADKIFFANLPVNYILDKWMFSKVPEGKAMHEITKAAAPEAAQEAIQQVMGNVATDKDPLEGVAESAIFGGLLGGAGKAIQVGAGKIAKKTEPVVEVTADDIAPEGPRIADVKRETERESVVNEGLQEAPDLMETDRGTSIAQEAAPSNTVKLTNSEIDKLADMGGFTVEKLPKVTLEQIYENAKEKRLDTQAKILADQALNDGRRLTEEEHIGLVLRTAQIDVELEQIQNKVDSLIEAGKREEAETINRTSNALEEERQAILNAGSISGTQASRVMLARKAAIEKEKFTLANLLNKAKQNKGENLSIDEKKKISEQAKIIKEQQVKIEKLRKKIENAKKKKVQDIEGLKTLQDELTDSLVAELEAQREVGHFVTDLKKIPFSLKNTILNIFQFERAMQTIADMSAVGRQAIWLATRSPIKSFKAFTKAFGTFFSQEASDKVYVQLKNSPMQEIRERAGLSLSQVDSYDISKNEEFFVSRWAHKIPGLSSVVRASERHMVNYLNLIRAMSFDSFVEANPNASMEAIRAWANYVNIASGKGDLGNLKGALKNLSAVFYAPQFLASRIQTPFLFAKYWKYPAVRNAILKNMAAFASTGMLTLMLAELAGAEVGKDPYSSDFGKIIIGDHRIDIWGGFNQVARVIILAMSAAMQRVGLTKEEKEVDLDRAVGNFLKYKLAPTITIPRALLTGKDIIGRDTTVLKTVLEGTTPLVMQDLYDLTLSKEDWYVTAPLGLASFLGVGVQTHQPKKQTRRTRKTVRRKK